MPDVLWPLFQQNRHLLHDLPVLGAQVLQQWARQKYGIRLMIVVIPHTFGRHLNFNCHLHILVSEGGLSEDGARWHESASFDGEALMPMWRYAVITLLRGAARRGVLDTDMPRRALLQLLTTQYERWWNIDIGRGRSKKQVLGYAGRYARRPPIAQHRFRKIDGQEIRFVTKDTRTKQIVETTYTPGKFLAVLADHILDRYRHNIRYFGLLAHRVKCQTHDAVFALVGQQRLGKPKPLRWAASLQKSSGLTRSWIAMDSGCVGIGGYHRHHPVVMGSGSQPWRRGSALCLADPKLIRFPPTRKAPSGLQSIRPQRFDPPPPLRSY